MLHSVYNKNAAVEAGSPVEIKSIKGNATGLIQVKSAGTATIVFQGRLVNDDAVCDWEEVYTFTGSGARQVALFPFMRVEITAQTGTPRVDAYIHE